jgi:Domain of unknown function (DUF4372)
MVGHSSLFSQVLSLVNRHQFERRVKEFGAEIRTKGFSALVRWNLFTYRDLREWINRPFDTPPESPPAQRQLFDLDSILPCQN